jgi:16S rRNA (guanine(527)-N(7))-methyltransferase RsmG
MSPQRSTEENSPLEQTHPNVSRETKIQLKKFIELVFQWQGKINLTGAKSPQEFCRQHVFDAIDALSVVTKVATCLDIGSGVGIPGLIWALLRPATQFYLVESLQKRAAFLHRVISKLQLPNVAVLNSRFEEISSVQIKLSGDKSPQIVSRGTTAPSKLWPLILHSPIAFQEWLVFSSEKTHREFLSLAEGSPLQISGLSYQRICHAPGLLTQIIHK